MAPFQRVCKTEKREVVAQSRDQAWFRSGHQERRKGSNRELGDLETGGGRRFGIAARSTPNTQRNGCFSDCPPSLGEGPCARLCQLASSLPGRGAHPDKEAHLCVLSVIA